MRQNLGGANIADVETRNCPDGGDGYDSRCGIFPRAAQAAARAQLARHDCAGVLGVLFHTQHAAATERMDQNQSLGKTNGGARKPAPVNPHAKFKTNPKLARPCSGRRPRKGRGRGRVFPMAEMWTWMAESGQSISDTWSWLNLRGRTVMGPRRRFHRAWPT
jgi:hypothetical protein